MQCVLESNFVSVRKLCAFSTVFYKKTCVKPKNFITNCDLDSKLRTVEHFKALSYRKYYYLGAVGRKVLWSSACVCLSVLTLFVRKISQERVHGSPPNLVGGSRG